MASKDQKQSSTVSAPTDPPAPPPEAPAPAAETVTISRAEFDQLLDGMLSMQDELTALKSAQVGKAAEVVDQVDETAKFDAELDALKDEFKDYPLIEVFERRALVGLDANLDIRLRGDLPVTVDPDGSRCHWKLRWFNFGKEGRAQQATAEGYDKVRWDELDDQESIAASARVDAFVRKGNRGEEVLCKIPRKLYDYKKRRDAARHAGLLTSESQLKDYQANTVASMVGARGGNADQAGSFVKGLSVTITPGKTERFTP